MTNIRIEGLDELIAKINTLEQLKGLASVMKAAALHVKGKIAQYPPRSHAKNPALYGKSARAAKMRRGFFAKLKSGEIEVPYRRGVSPGSERLGAKWTVRATGGTGAGMHLQQTIGNNVSYGPLVQSDKRQTAMHAAGGWKTVEQVAHEERGAVVRKVRQELERILNE